MSDSDSVLVGYKEICPTTEDSQFRFLYENCMPKPAITSDRQNPFSTLRM